MIDSAIILAISNSHHQSSLTQNRPSAMLPALGKPMVVRVMERLYRAGIRRYIVIVGLNEGAVASYLQKNWMPDATIEFELKSTETIPQLLARVAQKLENPFMVASYNTFTYERFLQSLIRLHDKHPDEMILTGAQSTLSPDGLNYYAAMEGDTIREITQTRPTDMKNFTLAECIICGHEAADFVKNLDQQKINARTFLDVATHYVSQEGAKVAIGETSWILCVDNDRDLLTLNKRLLHDSNDSHILSELPYSVKIIAPVRIDPSVSVGQGAVIGPNVYVERGSSIGYGTKIKNSLVLANASVEADADIDSAIVTTRGVIDVS